DDDIAWGRLARLCRLPAIDTEAGRIEPPHDGLDPALAAQPRRLFDRLLLQPCAHWHHHCGQREDTCDVDDRELYLSGEAPVENTIERKPGSRSADDKVGDPEI